MPVMLLYTVYCYVQVSQRKLKHPLKQEWDIYVQKRIAADDNDLVTGASRPAHAVIRKRKTAKPAGVKRIFSK